VSATGKVVAGRSITGIVHLTGVGSIVHFGGVLANGPKVRQFAGAQELGGVRWVIGARPIIETRVVLFTDGDGAIWTTPVTNTLAREVSQVGHTFSVHATGRVTGQLFSSAERSSREERKE
jgi:hypothetical protein